MVSNFFFFFYRLAEVQDLQGSSSDLTLESQVKTTTQHVPNKSQMTTHPSQQTAIKPQVSQPLAQPEVC